jgi:hypothetical protein
MELDILCQLRKFRAERFSKPTKFLWKILEDCEWTVCSCIYLFDLIFVLLLVKRVKATRNAECAADIRRRGWFFIDCCRRLEVDFE